MISRHQKIHSTNGIRGSLLLPRDPNPELTSSLDIAVFCPPHLWQIATSAGASRVGDSSNLLPLILDPINGIIPDRVVATNDQMGTMARLARILGPLGLMPTIRSGTLVPPAEAQIKEAIEYARKSSPFRVEREMATFSMLVSRCGWSVPLIRENVTTVMNWLQNQRKTTESNRFIENASFVIENMSESARNDSVTEEILPIAEIEYAGSKGPRFKEALVRLREEVAKRRASYVST